MSWDDDDDDKPPSELPAPSTRRGSNKATATGANCHQPP
eukprot:COSAG01_NODE_66931_length_268_cov_1.213018_1_plen_38_part_10